MGVVTFLDAYLSSFELETDQDKSKWGVDTFRKEYEL